MRFTVRVELHGLLHNHPSYDLLHSEMTAAGFSQTILSNDGIEYCLPTAEYNIIGEYTGEQIRTHAKKAITKALADTKFTYAVLVTPSQGRYWQGLDIVD